MRNGIPASALDITLAWTQRSKVLHVQRSWLALSASQSPQTVSFARGFAMAVALLGYFGTMVAALAALMLLLNTVLTSSVMPKPKPQPYPVPAITETAEPDKQPGPWGPPVIHKATDGSEAANAADAGLAAEKNKRLKLARAPKRRELAREQQEAPPHSVALGYDQGPQQQPASVSMFNLFGPPRF
jgi:hypothetical protein